MKIAWFDCSYGISGDMLIGALLSAGAPLDRLQAELEKLALEGVRTGLRRVLRKGLAATKFDVTVSGGKHPLGWKDMSGIVSKSPLAADIKKTALDIIKNLFEAEAKVHGLGKIEEVHLHELGSPDTVVDVLGALICLRLLGVETTYSSPVNLGGGTVDTQHGRFGVPAPATALLLEGAPVYGASLSQAFELTTPTGAALIKGLSTSFGPMPPMLLEKTGAGAGEKDPKTFPNVLRVFIGEAQEASRRYVQGGKDKEEGILVIETNIDDMNPQIYGYLLEKLLKAGALDAFLTPVIMKKGRPAIKLSVLCGLNKAPSLKELIFKETTTLGVRFYHAGRSTLEREIETIKTEFGPVRFKTSSRNGRASKSPEYDDCVKIAIKTGLPLREVMERLSALHGIS